MLMTNMPNRSTIATNAGTGAKAWHKLGLCIVPDRSRPWSRSHAMVPTPYDLGGGRFRIYYSGRDDQNRSHIDWADVDLNRDGQIVDRSVEPVLAPGPLGCFDDNGVSPSCIVKRDDGIYLYYIGWNPGSTTRMSIFGGLAISADGGKSFQRWSHAPILERCRADPYINSAPWVIQDGDKWRIYYVSGIVWLSKDLPKYVIKTGVSSDGRVFERDGTICIDFADDSEVALARPYVIREDGRYKMWFSHKGEAYRMGYAESSDGVVWRRDDSRCSLDVSPSGFDSEMVEYAVVVSHEGRRYMFYNGNNYGVDGIGLAVEER